MIFILFLALKAIAAADIPKFVCVDGVAKFNQVYLKSFGSVIPEPLASLALISDYEDFQQYMQACNFPSDFTQDVKISLNSISKPGVAAQVGYDAVGENLRSKLFESFSSLSIPIGFLPRILGLNFFGVVEIVLDDSFQAFQQFSVRRENTSKWKYQISLVDTMLSVLQYIPIHTVIVKFTSTDATIKVTRGWEHGGEKLNPSTFVSRIMSAIKYHIQLTSGYVKQSKVDVFKLSVEYYQQPTKARFFFACSNYDQFSVNNLAFSINNRLYPKQNPVTFLRCPDELGPSTSFAKFTEYTNFSNCSPASFSTEVEEFMMECNAVYAMCGKSIPYSYGFYLGYLLSSVYDDGALRHISSKRVLWSKEVLEDILGFVVQVAEYGHYRRLRDEAWSHQQQNPSTPEPHTYPKPNAYPPPYTAAPQSPNPEQPNYTPPQMPKPGTPPKPHVPPTQTPPKEEPETPFPNAEPDSNEDYINRMYSAPKTTEDALKAIGITWSTEQIAAKKRQPSDEDKLEIKNRVKKLQLKLHPDKNPQHVKEAELAFKNIDKVKSLLKIFDVKF